MTSSTMQGSPQRFAVLGAGSWGATLAAHLHKAGQSVALWCPNDAERHALEARRHPPGVPELQLPPITISADLSMALLGAAAAVVVVPSQAVESLARRLAEIPHRPALYILASKGIDMNTLRPLSEVLESHLPGSRVAVVSGPCIAREVALGVPTSVVSACNDDATARLVQHWFATPTFRVYRQHDVVGVELGGALKNVIAIAAGVGDGLGFGANSKSALLSRGLAEMQRFAVAFGGKEATIAGLAGLGDLAVTCFSPWSRNRRFGEALGRGMTPEQATEQIGETVEGVPTAFAATRIAQERGIPMPIAETVVHLVRHEWTPRQAVERLMTRELKSE